MKLLETFLSDVKNFKKDKSERVIFGNILQTHITKYLIHIMSSLLLQLNGHIAMSRGVQLPWGKKQ